MTLADRIAVLSGGRLMQYDTPEAIYHRPAALFVAGFTGAPPMNLAACRLLGEQAGQADLGDGVQLSLPPELAARGAAAESVVLGIRPEDITLAPAGDDSLAVAATVSLVEPLGAETLVTLGVGQAEFVARAPAGFRERPGAAVQVHFARSKLHLFDAQSGAAL